MMNIEKIKDCKGIAWWIYNWMEKVSEVTFLDFNDLGV